MKYEKIIPLIDTEYHLSFPSWFEKDGHYYIYPENSHSGKLSLYEYFPDEEKTVYLTDISTLPLVDAVMCTINGTQYMAATIQPKDNGNELDLYPVENGTVTDIPYTVEFDDNIGRNAGAVFSCSGSQWRPAQQCRRSYGEGVVIQKVATIEGRPAFFETKRLYSDCPEYKVGMHTFNAYLPDIDEEQKFVVIDARGYRYPTIACILKFFTGLFH